jgi:hypothetical protein
LYKFGRNSVFLGDNFDIKNTLKEDLKKIELFRAKNNPEMQENRRVIRRR